jgi:hypothetical protein
LNSKTIFSHSPMLCIFAHKICISIKIRSLVICLCIGCCCCCIVMVLMLLENAAGCNVVVPMLYLMVKLCAPTLLQLICRAPLIFQWIIQITITINCIILHLFHYYYFILHFQFGKNILLYFCIKFLNICLSCL